MRLTENSWNEVSTRCFSAAWKNFRLWVIHNYEGFEVEKDVNQEILSFGEVMGLEVDKEDVEELIQNQSDNRGEMEKGNEE